MAPNKQTRELHDVSKGRISQLMLYHTLSTRAYEGKDSTTQEVA